MRSNARWTSLPSRSSSIRWSCGCAAIRTATRTRTCPTPASSCANATAQGAAAFGWDKRNPEPRSMRDGSELVGWGMATGVWEALQMPSSPPASCSPPTAMPKSPARPPTSAPAPTRSWRRSRPTCSGLPLDNVTVKLGDSTLPQAPVEGGSWTAASVSHAIATTAEAVRKELLQLAKKMPNSPLADAKLGRRRAGGRQDRRARRDASRARFDRRRDAARRRRPHRAGEAPTASRKTNRTRATRTPPYSPR